MRELIVLWDPENPIVPARPIVEALTESPEVRVRSLTFRELGHQTLPNDAFSFSLPPGEREPDGILWIEGGPLPKNLEQFPCPKACWLVNTALEPTLLTEVGPRFDLIFSAALADCSEEQAVWLPVAGESGLPIRTPEGLSLLLGDPQPPAQTEIQQALVSGAEAFSPTTIPVVVALGNGKQPHPLLFDCLRSGAVVVADPETDLRGLAHIGEHLDVYPSREELPQFLRTLIADSDRLKRLASRGPALVGHLHEPSHRARRIVEGLWPCHRVLSGADHAPRVSILVTCYRYLRRFRVCLESLARQDLPPGTMEIVVADPSSPDGLPEALEEFAARYPGIRTVHLPLDARYHRNRGFGINRAFEVSRGEVVIGIDGDLVFPPCQIGELLESVRREPQHVYGIGRSFVSGADTEKILRGELDPFAEFDRLSRSGGDGEGQGFVGVLGYCQAVDRRAFARARYPEEFDVVNQSDIVFVERLSRWANVTPRFLQDRTALHLWHPRNWQGTRESL